MAELNPAAVLTVTTDQELFGTVDYPGDSLTWPLANLLNNGRPGNTFRGFVNDPTGDYLMQAPVLVFDDTDEAHWTLGGSTNYTHGTGAADVAGKKSLVWKGEAGAFSPVHTYARAAEEGLAGRFFIGTAANPAAATNFYITFSSTYRLALEPGLPIRLQTDAGAGWFDVGGGVFSGLGDCETFLSSVGRVLYVDVLPQTNPAWYAGLPDTALDSDQPPNLLSISLNGDAGRISVPCHSFPAGQLGVTGVNRQWGCTLARKRFAIDCAANLELITRYEELQGTPEVTPQGFIPPSGGLTVTIVPGVSPRQASATVAISVPGGGVDDTGYAVATVYLSAITADFLPIETPPALVPSWAVYYPVSVRWRAYWDQATMTARASAEITLEDTDGSLAPGAGGVLPAVRAARLWLGDDVFGMTLVMTGYTGLRRGEGFRWFWRGGRLFVTISLDDRLVVADQRVCSYQPAYDGTNHYWAMGRVAARLGFTTGDKNWPDVGKYEPGYFFLPYGTAQNPVMQPHPEDTLMRAVQMIRGASGDIDADTGVVQPMALGTNQFGALDYFPLPVGVVQAIMDPFSPPSDYGLSPVQEFSIYPQFDGLGRPLLNEILQTETVAALDQIRSAAVFEGIDTTVGDVALGYWRDPSLVSDPDRWGYIGGVPSPLIVIDRRVSSAPVAARLAYTAASQLGFPSIRTKATGHLQAWLFILTLFTMQEPRTQGTLWQVPYYCVGVAHTYDGMDGGRIVAFTQATGQLLGQAGA